MGKNIFVKNPFGGAGVGYCAFEVTVNGKLSPDEVNQSAFEIDFGNHNFESIEVLKYCKKELSKIESELLQFNKIAFLTIPPYKSESKDSEKLKYFHKEERAKEWMLSKV